MHVFTAALPDHHSLPGLPPAATHVHVLCGYAPSGAGYYARVAPAGAGAATGPALACDGCDLPQMLRWLGALAIGLPGGLATQLGHDAGHNAGLRFYWGEQGPEAYGPEFYDLGVAA